MNRMSLPLRRPGSRWPALAGGLVVFLAAGSLQASECRDAVPEGSASVVAGTDEPGDRLVLTGRVLDSKGRGLAGVRVYVFQTDAKGYYSAGDGGGQMNNRDPRLCGVLETDARGRYRVETIRPARYAGGGPEPHIHFEAWKEGLSRRAFHLTFTERKERGGEREAAVGDRSREPRPLVRDAKGVWHCVRDLVFR